MKRWRGDPTDTYPANRTIARGRVSPKYSPAPGGILFEPDRFPRPLLLLAVGFAGVVAGFGLAVATLLVLAF